MIIGTPESRFVRDILRKKLAQEAELNGEDFCKWIINNLCEANLKILALRLFPLALGSSSGEAVNQLVNFLGVFKDYLEFVRHFESLEQAPPNDDSGLAKATGANSEGDI